MTLLTSKEVRNVPWNFTCKACLHVPSRTLDEDGLQIEEDDYQRTHRNSPVKDDKTKKNLRWPVRCRSCDTENRRYHRMVKRLKRIYAMSEGIGQFLPIMRMPKLITFALPSVETIESDSSIQVKALERLLPKARELLTKNGVLGGTYVIECTTRLIWSDLALEQQRWKHHAHVHMVAVAPGVHRSKLKDFCEMLMPLGLGRINYKAPKGKWVEYPGVKFYLTAEKQVAKYIGKYLVKDQRSSRTFGVLRGREELVPSESGTSDGNTEPDDIHDGERPVDSR